MASSETIYNYFEGSVMSIAGILITSSVKIDWYLLQEFVCWMVMSQT